MSFLFLFGHFYFRFSSFFNRYVSFIFFMLFLCLNLLNHLFFNLFFSSNLFLLGNFFLWNFLYDCLRFFHFKLNLFGFGLSFFIIHTFHIVFGLFFWHFTFFFFDNFWFLSFRLFGSRFGFTTKRISCLLVNLYCRLFFL